MVTLKNAKQSNEYVSIGDRRWPGKSLVLIGTKEGTEIHVDGKMVGYLHDDRQPDPMEEEKHLSFMEKIVLTILVMFVLACAVIILDSLKSHLTIG